MARSAFWRVFEVGGAEALSFGFMVLLARLLDPASYGVVAIAGFFVIAAQVFVYRGLAEAVIQRENLTAGESDAAFWANVAIGGALCLGLLALARPAAWLTGEPGLAPVMAGLAPLMLTMGAMGIAQAHARREMGFSLLALRTAVSVLVGGTVGVGMALNGFGAWSLVGQQHAHALAGLAVLLAAGGWRPGWRCTLKDAKALSGFGTKTTASYAVEAAGQHAPILAAGLFLPAAGVGLFFLARRVVFSLGMLTFHSITEVGLPALSRLQRDAGAHRRSSRAALRLAGLVCFPAFAGVALTAGPLVGLLFGQGWAGASGPLAVLALAAALQAVPAVASQVLISAGRPGAAARLNGLTLLAAVPCLALLGPWGLTGPAWGVLAAQAVALPLAARELERGVGLAPSALARDLAPLALAAGLMALAVLALALALPPSWPAWALFIAQAGYGALAYALAVRAVAPRAAAEAWGAVRAGIRRG